jgi:hypothetical protein
MMSRAAKFLLVSLLLTLATSCLAQAAPATTRSILVNVFDSTGRPVPGLSKESFRVSINGNPVPVVDAKFSVSPRRIVLLLDMSGSMTGERDDVKWRLVRQALQDFLDVTPPDVPIAFLPFALQVLEVSDFAAGRNGIERLLQQGPHDARKIKHGQTALWDAVLRGLKILDPYQRGDSLFVITDAGDNASKASAKNADEMLLRSGTRLFALLFNDFSQTEEGRWGQNSFKELVADTGAVSFEMTGREYPGKPFWDSVYDYNAANLDKLKAYTRTLSLQIYGFWILDLAVPISNKQRKINLEIVDETGKLSKDVWLTYTHALLPDQ